MRILIVEDEDQIREPLKNTLQQEGYSVDDAADGDAGLFQIVEYPYDLAIVDLGLPKIDGIELIKKARKNNITTPIIILTARDKWQEKVAGLDAGADDYLTKPFHSEELLARCNALIRRASGDSSPEIEKGPLTINTRSQTIMINSQEIDLTGHEYKVLEYLILNDDKVITKTELTEHIYDQDFDLDSNVIEVFIMRLRKKLNLGDGYNPIKTRRGRGYQFSEHA
ncbi:response regulator transcription factor [Flocculibacter collagenilyticus]|uniref:response regulator transcription factor n=1 Tax=Flocculibacter collagenilyticus TaxID=2744479 RepID=UPI0018F46766|nr:response regulator transcription factor [Flocculibacter collagenilyticus]